MKKNVWANLGVTFATIARSVLATTVSLATSCRGGKKSLKKIATPSARNDRAGKKQLQRMIILTGSIILVLGVILGGLSLARRVIDNKKPEPDHLALAREASSNNDYAKAETEYIMALAKNDDPKVRKELAFVYQYERKPGQAIEAYESVLSKSDLRDVGSINNLANLYRDKQQYDKAEQLYLEAISKNANFTLAIINLNHLYILQGKYDKGIELVSKYYDHTKQKIDLGIQLHSDYKLAGKTLEATALMAELKRIDPQNSKLK